MTSFLVAGLGLWQGADDVGVTSVGDRQGAHAEVATASCSQLDVVAVVVMDSGLGEHRVVFDLGFSVRIQESLERLHESHGQWNQVEVTVAPRREAIKITP